MSLTVGRFLRKCMIRAIARRTHSDCEAPLQITGHSRAAAKQMRDLPSPSIPQDRANSVTNMRCRTSNVPSSQLRVCFYEGSYVCKLGNCGKLMRARSKLDSQSWFWYALIASSRCAAIRS